MRREGRLGAVEALGLPVAVVVSEEVAGVHGDGEAAWVAWAGARHRLRQGQGRSQWTLLRPPDSQLKRQNKRQRLQSKHRQLRQLLLRAGVPTHTPHSVKRCFNSALSPSFHRQES